ncbi:MAG TPA: hypothetical protein DD638_10710 [Pasteurellaceae bacterium]|nr:hypothetical protein [Pasteurellaceae bacterium]
MYELIKLITAIILPPFNLLILWVLSLILARFGYKKLSYSLAFIGVLLLYVISIPYTTQKLSDSLTQEDNLTLEDYKTAQAIVVLGGGLRDSKELFGELAVPQIPLERMRYTAYLHKQTQLPILVSGSSPNGNSEAKVMAQEFNEFFDTPVHWLEEKATTTKENALLSAHILEKEQIKRIILVTNQWHMHRAKLLFEKQGFEVLPASVGPGTTPQNYDLNMMHFIPQAGPISANMQLLKEWLGYLKEK